MLELLAGKNFDAVENEGSVVKPVEREFIWFDSSHEESLAPDGGDASLIDGDETSDASKPSPRKLNKSSEEDTAELPKKSVAGKKNNSQTVMVPRSQLFQELERELRLTCRTIGMDELESGLDPGPVKILVLGGPKILFTEDEIDKIVEFVHKGGGLLIANSYNSLFEQEKLVYEQDQELSEVDEEKFSNNRLMEHFGLRFKRLLSYPPEDISRFEPHFIATDVNKVFLQDPSYIEILPEMPKTVLGKPQVIARLPGMNEVFLVGVDAEYGRVVAIGDYAPFEDEYLSYGNHRQLILNIAQWVTAKNAIDCIDASIVSEVVKSEAAIFSITLKNSRQERLEYVTCLLESSVDVCIEVPSKDVRSIGPFNQMQLQWKVTPHQLGQHQLRLTIEIRDREPLFFDVAAEFECVLDGEVELVVMDATGVARDAVEVGKPFELRAMLKKTVPLQDPEFQVHLQSASHGLQIESMTAGLGNRWRLNALEAGAMPITVRVGQSERKLQPYLLQVTESLQNQIDKLERETLKPLLAQLQYQVSLISEMFNSEEIQSIPCKIYTPEDQLRLLNSTGMGEQKLEALRVARLEMRPNRPLVEYLMNHLAPTFSPIHGCCIPYDASLAAELGQKHKNFAEGIAQNLVIATGQEGRLPQNLAALVVHEKYGHGFFFNHTTLGRQLAILYRHGMTRNADVKMLKAPYPRSLYLRYRRPLQALWDSSLIVNEGFATWLEITVLTQMGGVMAEAAQRRKTFLFGDNGMLARAKKSEYFNEFPAFSNSRYREGCESLQRIQDAFGGEGTQYAMNAFLRATDIDLGISECNGKVQFALEPDVLSNALLEAVPDDARADMRLRENEDSLKKTADKVRSE